MCPARQARLGCEPALRSGRLTEAVLLRYGGLQAHRKALPLFLGLLVGGAVATWVNTPISMLIVGGQ
ncbi:MAG: DUF6784 domain-containing protein [Armatimonadota bacterium]